MRRAIEALSARNLLFDVVARLVGFGAGDQIDLLDLTAAVELNIPHWTHFVWLWEVEWLGLCESMEIGFEIRVVRKCLSDGWRGTDSSNLNFLFCEWCSSMIEMLLECDDRLNSKGALLHSLYIFLIGDSFSVRRQCRRMWLRAEKATAGPHPTDTLRANVNR